MALRAAKFSKKQKAVEQAPVYASLTASDIIRAPVPLRAIPLVFAGLIAPFKKHGRLSVRVEAVPQLARLSAGRNNGDGSWSLASDELEDLHYSFPENFKRHSLAVRIMSIDESAISTLKVFDYPIAPDELGPHAAGEHHGDESGSDVHAPPLQSALDQMQSLFAVRESELAALQLQIEQVRDEAEADLANARAAWQAELQQHLSAAAEQAASELDQDRRAWRREQDAQLAELEALAAQRMTEERAIWDRKSHDSLLEAEARWKSQSEAARADWQQQAARELGAAAQRCEVLEAALASARLEIAVAPAPDAHLPELGLLRGELDGLKALLAAREADLAGQISQGAQAREQDRLNFEALLSQAKSAWDARLEAALADAQAAKAAAASPRESDYELDRVRNALLTLQGGLQEREAQLASLRIEAEQQRERDRDRLNFEASLSQANAAWDTRLEAALADAQAAKAAAASPRESDYELNRVRNALLVLQGSLQEREAELTNLRAEGEQQRERDRLAFDASLSQAISVRDAEEAVRLASAEARLRQEFTQLLSEAAERGTRLELSLAEARAAQASAPREGEQELIRVRNALAGLQNTLQEREAELVRQRQEVEQARERWRQESDASLLTAERAWMTAEAGRLGLLQAKSRERETELVRLRLLTEQERDQWRQESEALRQAQQAGKADEEARLAGLQNILQEREAELTRQRQEAERERERLRQDAEASLLNAQRNWKADEAARMADLLASLQGREAEQVQQRLEVQRERERWRQDAETALSEARAAWKTEEAARLAATEGQWRARSEGALAEAQARYNAAELALERARHEIAAARSRDDAYVEGLRKEIAALQASLVDREAAVGHLRSEIDQTHLYDVPKPADMPVLARHQESVESRARAAAEAAKSRLVRDAILVACLAVPVIFFYPRLMSFVPQGWVTAVTGTPETPAPPPPAPFIAVAPGPAVSRQPMALVVRSVNMRATPSVTGDVVMTLQRDRKVTILGKQGNWSHVQVPAADATKPQEAKPQEGWVFTSYLGDAGNGH